MNYVTRLDENPSLVIHGLSEIAGHQELEVVALADSFGRTVTIRVAGTFDPTMADAIVISQGNNPGFVASAIVLAHKHNLVTARERRLAIGKPRRTPAEAFLNAFRPNNSEAA